GLGVLFELLWNNMTEEEKKDNLTKIRTGIKNLANQS
ncbi:MAG: small acid-soluble spore protein SspI, partial [Bacilli bacterium]